MRRWQAVLLVFLTLAFAVFGACVGAAQDAKPDVLAVQSDAQGWLWAQSTWSSGNQRKELAGGRLVAMAGFGRWGVGLRAESIGLPGAYDRGKPETFLAAQGYVALHRNVLFLAEGQGDGVVCGPTLFLGAAVGLSAQSAPPQMPKSLTLGVGLRASSRGWWGYVAVGQYQALPGVALLATAHVQMSDRTAWVGDIAVGARSKYTAMMGVAVRLF